MPVEDIDLRLDDNLNDNDQNLQLGEVQNDISSQNLDTKIIKSNSNKKEYKINIPPDSKPIVVLCGPPNSGKSMIIKCLADYLYNSSELGYTIKANRNLIADDDYRTFEELEYFQSDGSGRSCGEAMKRRMAELMRKYGCEFYLVSRDKLAQAIIYWLSQEPLLKSSYNQNLFQVAN